MERMQPPPNYYGAPLGYGNNMGQNGQPPTPRIMNPQQGGQMQPQPSNPPIEEYPLFPNQDNGATGRGYISLFDVTNNNRGKPVRVYCSFTDSSKWHDVIFEGDVYYASDDHVMIKEKGSSVYVAIVSVYINYVEFLEQPALPAN